MSSAGANADMAQLSAISDPRNLLFRILSGIVLGPTALALTFFGGMPFLIAISAVFAGGLREWLRLVRNERSFLLKAFGVPYVGLAMLSLLWLRDSIGAGWPMVFFLFLVVWASDIGAFAVGRAIGGARLAPKISPNKTWAGFFGGLVFSGAIAFIWTLMVMHASKPAEAVIIAVCLSLFAQAGDLFESAMKRRFNVKDSGDLIPGHGGILDRIDALLWAAPVFALFYALGLTVGLSP